MTQTLFNPEDPFLSTFRALHDYVNNGFDTSIYEIIFSFPTDNEFGEEMSFPKTIVHFEIDDVANPTFGFGDNAVDSIYNDETGTIIDREAQRHEFNFDIGIWASHRSGGVTSRLQAYTILNKIFNGPLAYKECFATTDGLQIDRFDGGQFIKEQINGVDVWRTIGTTLVICVYGRKLQEEVQYIQGIEQITTDIVIDDNLQITG